MRGLRHGTFGFLGGLAAFAIMAAASAQTPRSSVDMPTSQPVPEFKDPKTGQIWTPLNVGQQSGPPTPQDLAFDPLGQAVYVKGVVTQQPSIVPLSSVPITAGPTLVLVPTHSRAAPSTPSHAARYRRARCRRARSLRAA